MAQPGDNDDKKIALKRYPETEKKANVDENGVVSLYYNENDPAGYLVVHKYVNNSITIEKHDHGTLLSLALNVNNVEASFFDVNQLRISGDQDVQQDVKIQKDITALDPQVLSHARHAVLLMLQSGGAGYTEAKALGDMQKAITDLLFDTANDPEKSFELQKKAAYATCNAEKEIQEVQSPPKSLGVNASKGQGR